MMRYQVYRVFLWKTRRQVAADFVHEVMASSANGAIQAVLKAFTLTSAYYVWVTAPDDEDVDVHRYRVRRTRSWMKRG